MTRARSVHVVGRILASALLSTMATSVGAVEAFQLPPDPRTWSEKVAPEVVTLAASSTADLDVLISFRQPVAVQATSLEAMRAQTRVQWIAQTASAIATEWAPTGVRVVNRYTMVPAIHAMVPPQVLASLAEDSRVDAIVPNRRVHTFDVAGRDYVNVPAIQPPYTGQGVGIAFLDSGVDYTVPELAPLGTKTIALFDAYNAAGSASYAKDDNGHGTEVAGIAAAIGVNSTAIGVAPAATVVSVKVLDSSGNGDEDQITQGIDAILSSVSAGNPYDIRAANISFGGYFGSGTAGVPSQPCDSQDTVMAGEFQQLSDVGVLPVVAAGNGGCTAGVSWPACISTSLAVGSVYAEAYQSVQYSDSLQCNATNVTGCTDSGPVAGTIACYDDSGAKLDVWAPTGSLAPLMGGGYDTQGFFGTSASAPYVSGLVALLAQASPSIPSADIKQALRSTGIPITDPRNGITRNAVQANEAITSLSCTLPSTPTNLAANATATCSGQQVTVSWSSVSGASGYTIQVSNDSLFSSPTSASTTSTSYSFSSTQAISGTFYLRVAATNSCGASPWSSPVSLTYSSQCGTIYTHAYYLSGIAHLPGVAPAYYYSDVSILNPSISSPVSLRVSFRGVSTQPTPITLTLGARQEQTWRDVLTSAFNLTQTDKGMIVVESTLPLQVLSRTYSQPTGSSSGATFGASYVGQEASAALSSAGTGLLAGLRSDGVFRTDLEFVNASPAPTTVNITFYTAGGSQITTTTASVPAFTWTQLVEPLPSGQANAFAVVQVVNGGAQILGSATVIDGTSTDPTTIPMLVQ
jgi:subtilisin family serine protease